MGSCETRIGVDLPERRRRRSGNRGPVTVDPLVASTAGELGSRPVSIVGPNSRLACKSAVFARTGAMDERAGRIVGIDISKDRLDVHVLPEGEHVTLGRDEAGLKALTKRLAKQALQVVAMEATGGLEAPVAAELHAAGLPVRGGQSAPGAGCGAGSGYPSQDRRHRCGDDRPLCRGCEADRRAGT